MLCVGSDAGGPCGILGAIQGFVIYRTPLGSDLSRARALYGGPGPLPPAPSDAQARLSPSDEQQAESLAHALAWVIWQAMTSPEGLPLPGCTPTLVAAADDALLPCSQRPSPRACSSRTRSRPPSPP